MPAVFNSNTYTIYQQKEVAGDGPSSPVSPTREGATSAHDTSRTAFMIGAGALAAQAVVGLARSEIQSTTGDERLQNQINNMMIIGAYGLAIAKGGPIVALGLGIKSVTDEIQRGRERFRVNIMKEYETRLKGNRIEINGKG